uniref:Ig-like domain-containing protein n=1 Tax=Urocitellus parryii TaxID=9999 RepID=A0A8D2GTF7_UROPR
TFSLSCGGSSTCVQIRRSNGDSVTQTAGLVTLVEGASVILNCTYQTTYSVSFLFWYVQYLDKAPQLLLKSATENQRTESQGFHATLVKKENSFHLQKPAVQPSDSAVYYCAVGGTVRGTLLALEMAKFQGHRAHLLPLAVASLGILESDN